jgi:3-oxoadipate enol-lactonase
VAQHAFREEFGDSDKVLIMVHGLGGTTNTWYPQAQVLKRDFRIVLYDLCGSGRSPTAGNLSIDTHVEQLLDMMKISKGGPIHLAGHSMGTIICQHFAARYPELVLSLALLGAFPEPPEAARKALQARADKVRAEGMNSIADAIVAGGTSKDTKINNPSAAAFVRESIMAQSAEGYAANCDALAAVKSADLGNLHCDTLLITGDEDRTASPDVGRAMASAIRKSKLHIISGCGHWASIERPKQVNYQLTLFYSRLRQQGQA